MIWKRADCFKFAQLRRVKDTYNGSSGLATYIYSSTIQSCETVVV